MPETAKENRFQALESLFQKHAESERVRQLEALYVSTAANEYSRLVLLYEQTIEFYESEIWRERSPSEDQLAVYQQLFRELEALQLKLEDERHRFVVVIPVADRPVHLNSCLQSLYDLCCLYHYGGQSHGMYNKVSVMIADDSLEPDSILQHRRLAEKFTRQGLKTEYFGLDEQSALLASLTADQRLALKRVVGVANSQSVPHKGASMMRNISYLKLQRITAEQPDSLYFFIDSDQEFCIRVAEAGTDKKLAAVNYLYYLDRIFRQQSVSVLTGKVVGDPPVSPAVMAGNFLEDVIGFLQTLISVSPDEACCFHSQLQEVEHDAAYHDMADLFGFKAKISAYDYHCQLTDSHTMLDAFNAFAGQLQNFFYGEHPTRVSFYHYQPVIESIQPARTIYTGNYVFNSSALSYFIPFATLKLRMAGPVLGRVIKSELGDKFVSANLPMLHKRTVEQTGRSEFRPGVNRESEQIDLSGEFERQFYGDVMLFSMQQLLEQFADRPMEKNQVEAVVNSVKQDMLLKYQDKQQATLEKLKQLEALLRDPNAWWNNREETLQAVNRFAVFVDNIWRNFAEDAPGFALIRRVENQDRRCAQIVDGLMQYPADRKSWDTVLLTGV